MLKTSFFSPALFSKNIRRGWPIWGSYLMLWILILPVELANSTARATADDLLYKATRILSNLSSQWAVVICFIFAGITAMAVFNYMYTSRSSGMMHALPMTRLCLFSTSVISGLAFLLIPNLIVFLICAVITMVMGVSCWKYLFMWLYVVCGLCLFFFIFAAFCAQFTGNILALPVFYLIMNFLAIFLEAMVHEVMQQVTFGFNNRHYFIEFLSPLYYFFSNVSTSYAPYDPITGQVRIIDVVSGYENLIWYILAALVLAALAYLVYRRRQVESAGDIVAVKPVYHLFRWGVAFCVSLSGAFILKDLLDIDAEQHIAVCLCVLALISGFVGWFAADMLLKKTFRVFKGGWLKFGVYCLALIALMAALDLDLFGYERHIPDSDQVEYVVVESTKFDDPQEIAMVEALHQDILDSKAELEEFKYGADVTWRDTYDEDGLFSYYYMIYFNYYMKDGSTLSRKYPVPITSETQADKASIASRLDEMLNTPDKLKQRNIKYDISRGNVSLVTVNVYNSKLQECNEYGEVITDGWAEYTLYADDAYEMASAIEKDILEGNMGREFIFPYTDIDIDVYVLFRDSAKSGSDNDNGLASAKEIPSQYFYLTGECVHTLETIERLCVEPDRVR